MINKIGVSDSRSKQQVNFTGIGQVIHKTGISISPAIDAFEKSGKSMSSIIAETVKQPVEKVCSMLNIQDVAAFDKKFAQLKEIQEITNDLPNKQMFAPERIDFHSRCSNYLNEIGAVEKNKNFFTTLPAQEMTIGKGEDFIEDDFHHQAHKVIIEGKDGGVNLNNPVGNHFEVNDLQDKTLFLTAKTANIKNSSLGKVLTKSDMTGKNVDIKSLSVTEGSAKLRGEENKVDTIFVGEDLTANNFTSDETIVLGRIELSGEKNNLKIVDVQGDFEGPNVTSDNILSGGHLNLTGEENNVKIAKAKSDIDAHNVTGDDFESINSFIDLGGEKNIVGKLKAHDYLESNNLTSMDLESTESYINLLVVENGIVENGINKNGVNKIGKAKAKLDITAYDTIAKSFESTNGNVITHGKCILGSVKGKKFIPSKDTMVLGKIDAKVSVGFRIKNFMKKIEHRAEINRIKKEEKIFQ